MQLYDCCSDLPFLPHSLGQRFVKITSLLRYNHIPHLIVYNSLVFSIFTEYAAITTVSYNIFISPTKYLPVTRPVLGNHWSMFCLHRFAYSGHFLVNVITLFFVFCDLLLFIWHNRFFKVHLSSIAHFVPFHGWLMFCCIDVAQFWLYSSVDRHFGCFHSGLWVRDWLVLFTDYCLKVVYLLNECILWCLAPCWVDSLYSVNPCWETSKG